MQVKQKSGPGGLMSRNGIETVGSPSAQDCAEGVCRAADRLSVGDQRPGSQEGKGSGAASKGANRRLRKELHLVHFHAMIMQIGFD